jgi:ABC-type bacteriocin/lantibiotic exporter with double-glycine peptidase domain
VRRAIGFVAQNPAFFTPPVSPLPTSSSPGFLMGTIPRMGDGGVRLSGGQRQRVAIARALRKPKLLVLDEPTNNLDVDAVSRLMENLRKLDAQLALLLVSHDRDVVRYADQIFETENGLAVVRQAGALAR